MRITKNWKNILSIALAALVLFGAVGAVAAFATNDSKPAGAVFKVGGLDPVTGKYVKTDKTIYTEEAIDAYGLRIEPDFESTVTYDIYYYDNEDKLLAVVENQTEIYDEDFEVAEKCRIVIHPEIPEDVKEKDFKIHFWDVAKYAAMLKLTVSKESNGINYDNLYDGTALIENKSMDIEYNTDGTLKLPIITDLTDVDGGAATGLIKINNDDYDAIVVFIKSVYPPENFAHLYVADDEYQCLGAKFMQASNAVDFGENWHALKLDISDMDTVAYLRLSFSNIEQIEDFYIFTYND